MSRYENYTEQQLINEAIQVQNACNLSGVVRSFALITERLWTLSRENNVGTEWVNTHRVSRLFASKIQSLAGDTKLGDFNELE
jgi:hypothetical protein